ncbi:sensor histidine kinase [Nitrospina sp. 32_T5]|uniref:sensor histidine kinase n=1 Tax=unclassified Nitrospina TaxID=2638683 RepID=UPI003F9CCC45
MSKLRTLFHPIMVFIGVQIAWVFLMAIWINWYLKNRQDFQEFAQRLRPELFSPDLNWVILIEGCVLMLFILGGVMIMFVYYNKQARLNQMQSDFISSVSHELKSPLASIQLYLETMKYQKLSPEEARDFVETMLSDTERLSALIENILEASSPESKNMQLQLKPVEMKPFLEELVQSHRRQFEEKNCAAHLEIEEAPTLNLDKRAMRMVFNNLIGNALRYSSSGKQFKIRMGLEGKYYQIDFIDQGIGMDEKDRKKVFKKFYRVRNPQTQNIEGAGLGLYICNEIVKNHKGHIEVKSEGRDKGCVFTVLLPANGKPPGSGNHS